jgi:hypothetical protein
MLSTLEVCISPTLYRGDIYFTIYSVKTLAATRKWGCHMYYSPCVLPHSKDVICSGTGTCSPEFQSGWRECCFFVVKAGVEIAGMVWRLYLRGCNLICNPTRASSPELPPVKHTRSKFPARFSQPTPVQGVPAAKRGSLGEGSKCIQPQTAARSLCYPPA